MQHSSRDLADEFVFCITFVTSWSRESASGVMIGVGAAGCAALPKATDIAQRCKSVEACLKSSLTSWDFESVLKKSSIGENDPQIANRYEPACQRQLKQATDLIEHQPATHRAANYNLIVVAAVQWAKRMMAEIE